MESLLFWGVLFIGLFYIIAFRNPAESIQYNGGDTDGDEPEETPTRRRLVILETPYAPSKTEPEGRRRDFDFFCRKMYLRLALYDSLSRGESPFASHGLYTLALDDADADDRSEGITAGLAWGKVSDATVVYEDLGVSSGMQLGIEDAEDDGREVERRMLLDDPAARIAFYQACLVNYDRGWDRLGKFFAERIKQRCEYRDTVIRAIEEQYKARFNDVMTPKHDDKAGDRHD